MDQCVDDSHPTLRVFHLDAQLRTVFYDLATVLVEAKTENIHKNSVSMIVRGAWAKWNPKEPPLTKPEFFRLLFILAHLVRPERYCRRWCW